MIIAGSRYSVEKPIEAGKYLWGRVARQFFDRPAKSFATPQPTGGTMAYPSPERKGYQKMGPPTPMASPQTANYNFNRSMDALSGGGPLKGLSGGDRVPYAPGMAPKRKTVTSPMRPGPTAPAAPAARPSKRITSRKSKSPKKVMGRGSSKRVTARKSGSPTTTTKAAPGKGTTKPWWDSKLAAAGAGALVGFLAGKAGGRSTDIDTDIEYQGNVYNRYYNY